MTVTEAIGQLAVRGKSSDVLVVLLDGVRYYVTQIEASAREGEIRLETVRALEATHAA